MEKVKDVIKKKANAIALLLVFLLVSCDFLDAQEGPELDESVLRVESGLFPSGDYSIVVGGAPEGNERYSIEQRMELYDVPGVSIASINDYEIDWAKGYGVLEAGGDEPVTADTLFQAASIGKYLTSVAAMHFVENGDLDLDENANDSLISWQVPENALTAQQDVTLRRLLSHTAGVSVPGFVGYAQDKELPTRQQILNGEPPANNRPIIVDSLPGSRLRYSGGGYEIVGQLLEDVVGMSFSEIMEEVIFEPTGMSSSTYEVPLPEHRRDEAASAHDQWGQPVAGRWHNFPEVGSGASLWSTAPDLARFASELMLIHAGQSERIISQEALDLMLTPQIEGDEPGCQFGIGLVFCGEGRDLLLYATGSNPPTYWSLLVLYPERGQGVAIMTNGANGINLINEILNSIAVEYGWPGSENLSSSVE